MHYWNSYVNETVISGGEDKTVRIWSIHSSLCEKVLNDLSALVSAVSFSPNGRYLAAADTNGVVAVWSTKVSSIYKINFSGTGLMGSVYSVGLLC